MLSAYNILNYSTHMKLKLLLTSIGTLLLAGVANAQEAGAAPVADQVADVKFIIDNLWILISAALVFIMHLGFSALESGLCQKKNVVNVLFKNVFIISTGIVTYYLVGFNTVSYTHLTLPTILLV